MPVQSVKNTLDHRTGADNEEEIDNIQSALEKSSLSLDLEESSVSLELSSTMSGYSNTSVEYPNLQNCPSVAIEEVHFLSPHVEENVISSGFLWVGVGVEGDYSCLDCCFPVVYLLNHITGFALLSLQTINYLSHINWINAFVLPSAFFPLWSLESISNGSVSNEKRKRSLKQKLNNEWNVYYKKLRKEQKKKRKKWRNGSEKEPEEPAIKRKKDEGTQLSEAAMNETKKGELAQWPKTATNETKKDELAQQPETATKEVKKHAIWNQVVLLPCQTQFINYEYIYKLSKPVSFFFIWRMMLSDIDYTVEDKDNTNSNHSPPSFANSEWDLA